MFLKHIETFDDLIVKNEIQSQDIKEETPTHKQDETLYRNVTKEEIHNQGLKTEIEENII